LLESLESSSYPVSRPAKSCSANTRRQMMALVEGAQRQQAGVAGDLPAGKIGVNGLMTWGGTGADPICVSHCGVVFQLSAAGGSWQETILHEFNNVPDGGNPVARFHQRQGRRRSGQRDPRFSWQCLWHHRHCCFQAIVEHRTTVTRCSLDGRGPGIDPE
jgi:hypothetical protein